MKIIGKEQRFNVCNAFLFIYTTYPFFKYLISLVVLCTYIRHINVIMISTI